MKHHFFPTISILLFFLMLIFPKQVFYGASNGLLLWFQIVLPTLLPFMIMSNLLIQTNYISLVSHLFGSIFKKMFHISNNAGFAVLTGFLCGYPMGAKVTSDLVQKKQISKSEGNYLISFCNNTSPMFLISYVVCQNLKEENLVLPSMIIVLLSPIICSFLFRYFYNNKSGFLQQTPRTVISYSRFDFQILDQCIMDGFEIITKIGGYIILFSILLNLLKTIPLGSFSHFELFLSALEITNGIPLLLESDLNHLQKYISILALTSFGGLCSIAQTQTIIRNAGLSIIPYILEKLVTAIVTSLLAYIYVSFILQ